MRPGIVVVIAQVAAAGWSSAHPPECAAVQGQADNMWETAKSPALRPYCDLLAGASSKLSSEPAFPQAALAIAERADAMIPGRAAPLVLKGRALASLGRVAGASAALQQAQDRDDRTLEDAPALLTWARLNALTGRFEAASVAYRTLLPRASQLSITDRAAAATEAGLVDLERGPDGLDEAIAALREGLRQGADAGAPLAALGLALALDRRGSAEEARSLLAEQSRVQVRDGLATSEAERQLALVPVERFAVTALASELADPPTASDAWKVYLSKGPPAPWAAHAKARMRALGATRGAMRERSPQ